MQDWRDTGEAAHQLELERQEEVTGYFCPFCATVYSTEKSDCDGTDLVCCGEVGECIPYTLELETLQ